MTAIISGFPGVGKTHLFNLYEEGSMLDSDSSKFSWISMAKGKRIRNPEFPINYIDHIKAQIGKVDIILVSSHKEVREALVEAGIKFFLVFPRTLLKEEYLLRYIERGSSEEFIDRVEENWDSWIEELTAQENCKKIVLKEGQYLSDAMYNVNYYIRKGEERWIML